jgi:hypothetical protein
MKPAWSTRITACGPTAALAAWICLLAAPAFARLPQVVPEPTTLSLIGAGAVGLIAYYRIKRGK